MKIKLQIREVVEHNHEITVDAGDIVQAKEDKENISNAYTTQI